MLRFHVSPSQQEERTPEPRVSLAGVRIWRDSGAVSPFPQMEPGARLGQAMALQQPAHMLLGADTLPGRQGHSLAAGDFDGDGSWDLAMRAPLAHHGEHPGGAVMVLSTKAGRRVLAAPRPASGLDSAVPSLFWTWCLAPQSTSWCLLLMRTGKGLRARGRSGSTPQDFGRFSLPCSPIPTWISPGPLPLAARSPRLGKPC